MRLISFRIFNVKSIVDSGLCHLSDADNINVFAGQNEAGKSAVLESLNYFGNGPDEKFIKLSRRLDAEPQVVCTFKIETKDCNSSIDHVNDVLKEIGEVVLFRKGVDSQSGRVELDDDSHNFLKQILINIDFSKRNSTPEESSIDVNELMSELYNNIVDHINKLLPEFIYYDSFSGLLPGEIEIANISSNQAVMDFEKVFNVNFSEAVSKNPQERSSIKNDIQKRAELDLNTYWTQKRVDGMDDKYHYDINLIPSKTDSRVEFLIHKDGQQPLFLEQKSKGFQWFNAFILRLKAIGVENKNFYNYILLIDEPGQGLHETAQKNVKTVLEELASNGMRILYTTHNPSLIGIDGIDLLRIRLVYQTIDNGTKIQNIAQFASANVGTSKDALSPIITAMGINNFGQILNENRKCVVLEGVTDHYYLSAFKKILDIDSNYAFIPACGVLNVKPLVSILLGWGYVFKAVFDDGKEGRKAYAEIAKYLYPDDQSIANTILKLEKFDGIEDLFSKKDFETLVVGSSQASDKKNSDLAKELKKELIARLFLHKVSSESIKIKDFDQETLSNFSNVFSFLSKT